MKQLQMAAVWISGRASDFDGDGCEDPVTARFGPGLTVFEASHRKDTEGNRRKPLLFLFQCGTANSSDFDSEGRCGGPG